MTKICTTFALALTTLVWVAGSSAAQGLTGEWRFERQGHDGIYSGTIVVDRQNQVRLKGRSTKQNYSECGYVQISEKKVDIVFTSAKGEIGYDPDRFYCSMSDGRSLTCYNVDAARHHEPASFSIRRVGDVPDSPAGRLEDVCPVQPSPQV